MRRAPCIWRTLECDAVLHLANGQYGLAEIKLGGKSLIGEGVATLEKLSALIRSKGMKEPAFRMVVTGMGSLAYEENGIEICPLAALKP